MPNAKVGDICYVSSKAITPGLAGHVVEVVRLFTDPDEQFPVAKGEVKSIIYTIDTEKACVCKSSNLPPQGNTDSQRLCWTEQRVMELMARVEKRFLVALDARFVALEMRLDDRLRQLGERMEDLEDRNRR